MAVDVTSGVLTVARRSRRAARVTLTVAAALAAAAWLLGHALPFVVWARSSDGHRLYNFESRRGYVGCAYLAVFEPPDPDVRVERAEDDWMWRFSADRGGARVVVAAQVLTVPVPFNDEPPVYWLGRDNAFNYAWGFYFYHAPPYVQPPATNPADAAQLAARTDNCRTVQLQVPAWFATAVPAAILFLPHLVRLPRRLRRARRRRKNRCVNCGYDLRGTPNRCPECGAAPSPAPQ